jgi:hypothetical protein
VEQPRRGDFVDEGDHGQAHRSLFASFEADFGQRAVDDFAKAHQATAEDRSGATVDSDGASLQCMEREDCGVQGVAKFVRRVAQAFSLLG